MNLQPWLRLGRVAFGAALLASGAAKIAAPLPLRDTLLSVATSLPWATAGVFAAVVVEVTLGSWLLLTLGGRRCRPAAALAGLLAVAHTALRVAEIAQCGCHGTFDVPDALTYAVLGAGGLACAFGRRGSGAAVSRWGLAAVAALALASAVVSPCLHTIAMPPDRADQAAALQVLRRAGFDPQTQPLRLVVGSRFCSACIQAERNAASEADAGEALRCVVFLREDEPEAPPGTDRCPAIRVPSPLWEALLRGPSPGVFSVQADALARIR